MYNIYRIVTFLLIPIILINTYVRIFKNKEDKKRVRERFGLSNFKKPKNKKLIWIHAASVGEFKSCDFLINHYYKSYCLLIKISFNCLYSLAYYCYLIVKIENLIHFWKIKDV